jgi:hypothetical protein
MRGQAYDVFHGAPEGAMYEETIGATKDWFEDHLSIAYCSQAKTRTQDDGDSLRELAMPLNSWPIVPFLHCKRVTVIREQARHSLIA